MNFGEKYKTRSLDFGVKSLIRSSNNFRTDPKYCNKEFAKDLTNVGSVKVYKKGDRVKQKSNQ